MNNSFVIVMRFLSLFAHGTSCMLAGLVSFCQHVKSQTQKLITILIVQMNNDFVTVMRSLLFTHKTRCDDSDMSAVNWRFNCRHIYIHDHKIHYIKPEWGRNKT